MTKLEDSENDEPSLNGSHKSARHVFKASRQMQDFMNNVEPVIIVEDLQNHSRASWVSYGPQGQWFKAHTRRRTD